MPTLFKWFVVVICSFLGLIFSGVLFLELKDYKNNWKNANWGNVFVLSFLSVAFFVTAIGHLFLKT